MVCVAKTRLYGHRSYAFIAPGEKEIPEVELDHLEGHKQSRPVRIGNGAADHVQLVRI
jgi:GH15 family glucan-1,4-alpha-glucosidase